MSLTFTDTISFRLVAQLDKFFVFIVMCRLNIIEFCGPIDECKDWTHFD